MSDIAILFAYGMVTILVLIGYAWVVKDIKHIKKQLGIIQQRLTWSRTRELDLLKIIQSNTDMTAIRPKNKGKTFKTWARKGHCPSCNVGTGSKHHDDCKTRASLLKQIQ